MIEIEDMSPQQHAVYSYIYFETEKEIKHDQRNMLKNVNQTLREEKEEEITIGIMVLIISILLENHNIHYAIDKKEDDMFEENDRHPQKIVSVPVDYSKIMVP